MSETLRVFFLCIMFAGIMTMQLNYEIDKTGTRQLRDALELAVHDASLNLDKTKVTDGYIVFDQPLAEQMLKNSLATNLKLEPITLNPLTDSFFKGQIRIVYLEYIDDESIKKTGDVFPFNYRNPTYNLLETIYGPSIVAVVETTSKRFNSDTPITLRQAVVYEYKK